MTNNFNLGLKSEGDLNVIFIFMFVFDFEICYISHRERRNRDDHKEA